MGWIIVSWFAYGIWAITEKKVADTISIPWAIVISALSLIPLNIWMFLQARHTHASTEGILWAAAAGITGMLGSAAYVAANRVAAPVNIAVLVATYPVIPVLYFALCGETFSFRKLMGIACGLAAAFLLSF